MIYNLIDIYIYIHSGCFDVVWGKSISFVRSRNIQIIIQLVFLHRLKYHNQKIEQVQSSTNEWNGE